MKGRLLLLLLLFLAGRAFGQGSFEAPEEAFLRRDYVTCENMLRGMLEKDGLSVAGKVAVHVDLARLAWLKQQPGESLWQLYQAEGLMGGDVVLQRRIDEVRALMSPTHNTATGGRGTMSWPLAPWPTLILVVVLQAAVLWFLLTFRRPSPWRVLCWIILGGTLAAQGVLWHRTLREPAEKGLVMSEGAILKEEPHERSQGSGELVPGEECEVLAASRKWFLVRTSQAEGWLPREQLRLIK